VKITAKEQMRGINSAVCPLTLSPSTEFILSIVEGLRTGLSHKGRGDPDSKGLIETANYDLNRNI